MSAISNQVNSSMKDNTALADMAAAERKGNKAQVGLGFRGLGWGVRVGVGRGRRGQGE